jgi:tetratricopeptide (TPR) repeat protein
LVAGGYGLYHYVSDDVPSDSRRGMSQASVAPEPTSTKTVAEAPTPSPTVAKFRAPSPNPTTINRSRQDDRQLADKHFEQARALYLRGDYRAALRKCDETLKLDPRHGKALELKRKINDAIRILSPR